MESDEYIFEMRNITKRYPGGVLANKNVDFNGKLGEIHALVGENGAGKTTLMHILSGLYKQNEGEIYVDGEKVNIKSPREALKHGIGMVHQERFLIPAHSVIENIVLGAPEGWKPDKKKVKKQAEEICKKYNLKLDLDAKISELSAGEKQLAEILKVLYLDTNIVILDEPTSVLTPEETERFLGSIKKMAEEGNVCIVFISHKLPVVLNISDRITVLRGGEIVGTTTPEESSLKELSKMMVGREVLMDLERETQESGEVILELENISAKNDRGIEALKDVSLEVREGEILSIAGVSGNGQGELMEVIMGLRKPTKGKIIFRGVDVTNLSVQERWKKGLAYIPSERVEVGVIEEYNLVDNVLMCFYHDERYCNRGVLDYSKLGEITEKFISEYKIKAEGTDTLVGHLSGGNIQKLILSRVLARNPDLLLAEDPTHGLDVASMEFVRKKLLELRRNGKGVLLVSKDLDEVISISDRIAPIYEGEIMGVVSAEDATKDKIGHMMMGEKE